MITHDGQEQWDGYFQSDPAPEATANTSAGTGGTNDDTAGIWSSLRSRLQATETASSQDDMESSIAKKVPKSAAHDAATTPEKKPGKKTKRPKTKVPLEVKTIQPNLLRLNPVDETPISRIPTLHHNLDRVLFNPGVYHMQDHRSGVFNFDPYLASIMPVDDFDFDALKEYITSSKDARLRQLCAAHGMKYCGSTSSMTSILSHLHFLLSAWRRPNFDHLSRSLELESLNFTMLSRGPVAAFAHFQDGVYAIDADKEYDTENVLSQLGHSMEKLLTLPKEEFEKYRRTKSHQLTEEEKNAEESYHFTTLGDFMMRSQLDAHDPRLPGSGVVDVKTRAVVSIRMDVGGYEKGVGYEIRKRFGQWESFEREYYDMIRAAFLKYSLQVRMGRMDGIFVAYHNTQRIFGFQYVSLAEMDQAIHGTSDTRLGDMEFKCSIALLNDLMDRATKKFPGRTLRLHVETRPTKVPLTYFFVEPVTEEQMKTIQAAGTPSVEQLEREIRDLSDEEREAESASEHQGKAKSEGIYKANKETSSSDPLGEDAWAEMMDKVDDAVENESLGVSSVKEAIQEALEQSGLLQDKTELQSEKYLDELVSALTAHSSETKEARESREAKAKSEGGDPEPSASSTTLTDLILRVTEAVHENRPNLRAFEQKIADLATQAKRADSTATETPSDHKSCEAAAAGADSESDAMKSSTGDREVAAEDSEEKVPELLGMYVSIRNRVDGEFVERPEISDQDFDWAVQYTVTELPDKRAQRIYSKIKKRRKEVLAIDPSARSADWYRFFRGRLPIYTKEGRKFREKKTLQEANSPIYVAWDSEPLPPSSAGTSQKGN